MKRRLRALFAAARAEGREVLGAEEFLMLASLAGITKRQLGDALADDILRRGLTGYWLTKAADPGALAVMRAVMRETSSES